MITNSRLYKFHIERSTRCVCMQTTFNCTPTVLADKQRYYNSWFPSKHCTDQHSHPLNFQSESFPGTQNVLEGKGNQQSISGMNKGNCLHTGADVLTKLFTQSARHVHSLFSQQHHMYLTVSREYTLHLYNTVTIARYTCSVYLIHAVTHSSDPRCKDMQLTFTCTPSIELALHCMLHVTDF